MADAFLREQDSFFCAICLELLRDPVAIPCGHNYCMGCISSYWDQDEQRGCYSCPQCRHTSPQRPVLNKNPLIAQLVDRVRARLTAVSSSRCSFHAGHHLKCEFCSGDKHRSVRQRVGETQTCSSDSKAGGQASGEGVVRSAGRHEGLEGVEQLRDNICSHSEKLLEMFGRSQQQCICSPSPTDEHMGLKGVMATAEATGKGGKQGHFHKIHTKSHQRIQDREKELQELRKAVEILKRSAHASVEDSERAFSELLRCIERRAEEKAKLQQAEELLRRLQEEVTEMRKEPRLGRRSPSLNTQQMQHAQRGKGCKGSPSIMINQHFAFDEVKQSVNELTERLDSFLIKVQSVLPPDPETRDEFLQYCRPLTLDPNTAHRELSLSEGNRRVTHCDEYQSYPFHPERFDGWEQVLCREGTSGRCYWEVEWSGEEVSVAVAYKDISRKGHGHECGFGSNNQSWSLDCSKSAFSFRHDNMETELPLQFSSNRIGVYVDHRAGTLAFYSISDTMTLLHIHQTTFTHTLYPGFWLGFNFHHGPSSVKLL